MERTFLLNSPLNNEDFKAWGEIQINESLLGYNFQNGIASFSFIKRNGKDSIILEALSGKWVYFEEYKVKENQNIRDARLGTGFFAFLSYGYYSNDTHYFYVQSVIQEKFKEEIFIIDVFSTCLINHLENADNFDFNSLGYIDDLPCAKYEINNQEISVYRTVAVEYVRNKANFQLSFQKSFVGGFRFVSNVPFTNDLIKKCVIAVNEYCCFVLRDYGFFVSNVEIIPPDNRGIKGHLYFAPKSKDIETEVLFSFDDIKESFQKLMELFIENDTKFLPLYSQEANTFKPLDILRIASMFENQYRKNVESKMVDYVHQEKEYRLAYENVIQINETVGKLEGNIVAGEKSRRKHSVMSSLKMQLQFVFDKLLRILGTNKQQIKQGFGVGFLGYDISNLATTIKDARNDIAHYLENSVDYLMALKDTFILQLMIYYMIFERIGLSNDIIKKIILESSPISKRIFGVE